MISTLTEQKRVAGGSVKALIERRYSPGQKFDLGMGNGAGLHREIAHLRARQILRTDKLEPTALLRWRQCQRLEDIRGKHAAVDIRYRFACRVGMCGSCAMMVNGQPRWTCRTHVQKVLKDNRLEIAPLRNLPVIRDLVTDMSSFFDKWVEAEGVFIPTKTRDDPLEPISPNSPARMAANEAIECINCAICYSACDVVAANPEYLGPAALNRAWTLLNDERDGGRKTRLDAISSIGGCHNCHSMGNCVQFCPNELIPTASIAGLKRETVKAAFGWRK